MLSAVDPVRRSDVTRKVKCRHQSSAISVPYRREAGRHDCRLHLRRLQTSRRSSLTKMPCPSSSLRRREHLVPRRIVDDADDELAGHLQPDRDAVERHVMDVVGGAVDGVDDPGGRRRDERGGSARGLLLAEEGVAGYRASRYSWISFCDARSASVTRSQLSLLADLELLPPPAQRLRGPASGLLRGVQSVVEIHACSPISVRGRRTWRQVSNLPICSVAKSASWKLAATSEPALPLLAHDRAASPRSTPDDR